MTTIPNDRGESNPLLEAALAYHALDWAVIPICPPDHAGLDERHTVGCNHPGKVAVCKNWQATRLTEADLRRRWAWIPTFNVGVVMGPLSGLCGLDVDGPAGWKLLLTWMQENGQLPHTLCFETPGGGVRYLFCWPETGAAGTRGWNIDGRQVIKWLSAGTYTVMPPSRHVRGGEYAWVNDCRPNEIEPAEAPTWLLDLAAANAIQRPLVSDPPPENTPAATIAGGTDLIRRAWAYLTKMGPCDPRQVNRLQDGSQHLFKACCKLVWVFGLEDATALQLLHEWDRNNLVAPYPEKELLRQLAAARAVGTPSRNRTTNQEGA